MARWLTEAIGTFFLVAVIGLTVPVGLPEAPLAIGAVLMVMVYMGGHVSGAHYNPAVSVALALQGALPRRELVPYLVAQFAGAAAAAATLALLGDITFAPAPTGSYAAAFVWEVLFTFALVLVILNVAVSPVTAGNAYYGLAIGSTVAAGAFAVGPVSGAAFNPAVGLAPSAVRALVEGGGMPASWLYLVAPVLGGLLAVPVFSLQERSHG